MLHLLPRGIERSRVIDYEIGSFDFFFVRNLRRHAPSYFGTSGVFRNSQALGETQNALFGMAGYDDQTIETPRSARFQDQRSLDNGDGVRIAAANFFHPLVFVRNHGGMNNLVQLLHPRRRAAGLAERGFGQPRTIDASVRIQDLAAKAANHFLVDRAPRLHKRVRDRVGLDQLGAELDKHLADRGLAAGDTASEAEF